ncbi:MAG: RNA methyltransferase [Candidatus Fibromonas sp.]|jgi:tRNA/rRNA methyltransferase/tRNA (cytidine32/uridine32-2'-O)-methyltransferase|nr:RNA methyltransferase [Candidatus Fibromonas sp.]
MFTIILVEPEHPHNVGFVARSMRSNGLSDLRIVCKSKPLPRKCYNTAHASTEILDKAKLFGSLKEAIADCSYTVAFSRRLFNTVVPHVPLPELSPLCMEKSGIIALVFGRESCGLSFDEIELCGVQCEIPVAGQMSINLSHAVSVASYELCRSGLLGEGLAFRNKPPITHRKPATIEQFEGVENFILENLTDKYKKLAWTKASIRTWLQKLNPSQAELSAVFGMLRALAKKPARGGQATYTEPS